MFQARYISEWGVQRKKDPQRILSLMFLAYKEAQPPFSNNLNLFFIHFSEPPAAVCMGVSFPVSAHTPGLNLIVTPMGVGGLH